MTKLQKGFTLIELLVVIAIIGILAGILYVAIDPAKQTGKANDATKASTLGQVVTQAAIQDATSWEGVCDQGEDTADLMIAAEKTNGTPLISDPQKAAWLSANCNADATGFAAKVSGYEKNFCVDATGLHTKNKGAAHPNFTLGSEGNYKCN